MSILVILEMIPPPTNTSPKMNIETPDKNMECLIFRFIP